MAKKRVMKIPKNADLKCPLCNEINRAKVSIDNCPQSFTCPKCDQTVRNPITQCCIICAFSNNRCPRTLYMEAKVKGLILK